LAAVNPVRELGIAMADDLAKGAVKHMDEAFSTTSEGHTEQAHFQSQMGEDKFLLETFFQRAGPDGGPLR
jgi:hypothetical protein